MSDDDIQHKNSASSYNMRLLFLLVIGSAISCYLLYHHISVNGGFLVGPSLCNFGGNFNCDDVARSAFAELAGIPVASWGLWFYLLFAGFIAIYRPRGNESITYRSAFAAACFSLSCLALIPTLALFGASVFVIGSLCLFCSILYVINLSLALVTFKHPDRTPGFSVNLNLGLRVLLQALCTGRLIPSDNSSPRAALIIPIGGAIALGALIWGLQPLLISQWFVPRQLELKSRKSLLPVLCDWAKQPLEEGLVSDADDLSVRDYSHGPETATLEFVEFSDFECPFCRRASKVFKSLVKKYSGQVRVVFKNFPLDSSCNTLMGDDGPHQFACDSAIMARCAGMQSEAMFWKMHDSIFELENFSAEALQVLPEAVGVDLQAFSDCMNGTAGKGRVEQDVELGGQLEIQGTPSIFLNGRRLTFPQLEVLDGIIELLLKDPQLLAQPEQACR